MSEKQKRTWRTIKNPACKSKKITVKEAEKAEKECKKGT